MPMRNRPIPFHSAFRIPHSAFALLIAACNPATTRPDFRPFPQALTVVLLARPERVIPVLATLVAAESLRVKRASPRDGYQLAVKLVAQLKEKFGSPKTTP